MRHSVSVGLLLAFLVTSSQPVTAAEAVVSWDVEFWSNGVVPGVGAPISMQNFPKATAICNLPMTVVPPGAVLNPDAIAIADPVTAGRDCLLDGVTSAGTLQALPFQANMFATARARGATTLGPRSPASNRFTHAPLILAPTVPSGVVVIP